MALKQLILSDKLRKAQEKLALAQQKAEEQRSAREALETREQELIQAREEVNEETTPEEQKILEEQIEAWEEQEAALTQTENEIAAEIETVQQEIADLEQQLEEVNARGMAKPKAPEQKPEERKERTVMNNYNVRRLWFGMDHQERDQFLAKPEVKEFLNNIRSMIGNNARTVTNANVTISPVVAPVIREVILENSKLLKYVNVLPVSGDVRQPVMGTPGEAVWTDMCAVTNEMDLGFGLVEVDGYMVSAFIPLCNAVKDDSDIDLATTAFDAIGHGIAVAIDKAILFGKGIKMPLGILTRLEQTEQPADYPKYAPKWENLSASHIIAISEKTDTARYKAIMTAAGAAKSKYSAGGKFWAMNEKTKMKLMTDLLSITAAGAVASGLNNEMPLIGGEIVIIDDVPDNVIIGGYGKLYTVGERQSKTFSMSEHVFFLQNQTVFKGVARYDGKPAIAEAFVAIGIEGNTPTAAAVTFAADKANKTV